MFNYIKQQKTNYWPGITAYKILLWIWLIWIGFPESDKPTLPPFSYCTFKTENWVSYPEKLRSSLLHLGEMGLAMYITYTTSRPIPRPGQAGTGTQSCQTLCDPMDCSQAPLSMGFSKQEYWSGLPFPLPGGLPNSGTEHMSPGSYIGRWVLCHWASRQTSPRTTPFPLGPEAGSGSCTQPASWATTGWELAGQLKPHFPCCETHRTWKLSKNLKPRSTLKNWKPEKALKNSGLPASRMVMRRRTALLLTTILPLMALTVMIIWYQKRNLPNTKQMFNMLSSFNTLPQPTVYANVLVSTIVYTPNTDIKVIFVRTMIKLKTINTHTQTRW